MSTKIHDLANCADFKSVQVSTLTQSTTSSTCDLLLDGGLVTFHLAVGTPSGTGASVAVTVQESTDGTTWTAVAGEGTNNIAAQTAAGDYACTFQRSARYLRAVQVVAGTTPVIPVGACFIEQKKTL